MRRPQTTPFRWGAGAWLAVLLVIMVGGDRALGALTDAQRVQILAEAQGAYDSGISVLRGDPQGANEAFHSAAARFQQLVDDGISNGTLHYNLANAYLQAGELGRAILHYRKAHKLIPGDARLEHNLEYARTLRRSRIAPSGQRALAGALLGWHERFSLRARFHAFLGAYVFFWVLLAALLLRPWPPGRWLAVVAAVAWLACGVSVAADLLADQGGEAVVLADDVVVRKGNSTGFEPQFEQPLHQGVELRILDERGGWLYIELPNGKTGWIPADQAGVV